MVVRTGLHSIHRKYRNLVAPLLGIVAMVFAIGLFVQIPGTDRDRDALNRGPNQAELQRLVRFTAVSVSVSFIQEANYKDWRGTVRGLWIIKGRADLATELDTIDIVDQDQLTRTATIRLVTPRVESVRIDHERTRLYDLSGSWAIGTPERASLQTEALRQAERRIRDDAISRESVVLAKRQTENVIRRIYATAGWDVSIDWTQD